MKTKSVFGYDSPGKIKGLVKAASYKGMNTDGFVAEYVLETKTKQIQVRVIEKEDIV